MPFESETANRRWRIGLQVILVGIVAGFCYHLYSKSNDVCAALNAGRAAGAVRLDVQTGILRIARDTRLASAKAKLVTDPVQSKIDFDAASAYEALRLQAQATALPVKAC